MGEALTATCKDCGSAAEVTPPTLPASGGALSAQDDPVKGWQVLELVYGSCWERRPRHWICVHCGGSGSEFSNWCDQCGGQRADPRPYVPDWDAIGKEMEERRREAEAIVAEWDRDYPGWRSVQLMCRWRI
jgi:rubredoxin